jgi:uracil-DNA glycosylase family 4
MSDETRDERDKTLIKNNVVDNIRNILEFYQVLGFESLPIKIVLKSGRQNSTEAHKSKSGNTFLSSELSSFRTYGQKETALRALREEIGDCKMCKLSKGRTHIVFGEGNPNAGLMFIGEAPGREEDLRARPFVGDAGMLLSRLIEKMGFKRSDVYIANIVKCRPPSNRDPEMDEIEQCRGFIEKQIDIIHPGIIMSLGRISAQTLTGNTKLKITAARGNFFDYKGIPLMPTFHPAYLIRNPKDKWLTWSDAQKVLERLKARCRMQDK